MQRLVAHAEEVAYNDPPSGASEQLILNQHLYRLLRHNKLSAFQRFVQQVQSQLDTTLYLLLHKPPVLDCQFLRRQSSSVLASLVQCSIIQQTLLQNADLHTSRFNAFTDSCNLPTHQ